MSKNTNLSFLTDYITADITNGRIGINNASPTVAFDVSGATRISGALTLTGALSGTSATFSSNVTATNFGAGSGSNQASIGAGSLGFYNAAASPKYIQLTDDSTTINSIGFSKSGSVATTWFPSGNVGVGTTTPVGFASDDLVFQLYNSGAAPSRAMIRLTNSVSGPTFNNGALLSMDGALDFYVANQEAGNLIFQTSNTERMRITSAGNVGIGTSSPVSLLSLSSDNPIISLIRSDNGASARGAINFYATSTLKWQIGTNEISGTAGFEFNFAGTNVAIIGTTGAASFSTVSANTFYGGLYAPTYNNGTTFINFYDSMVGNTSRAAVMYNSADSPTAGGMWTVQFVKWDGAYGSMTALNMEPGTQTFYVKTLYNGTWSAWVQK